MVFIQTELWFLRRRHFKIFLLAAINLFLNEANFVIWYMYLVYKMLTKCIENKCKVYLYDFDIIH
jgi:hypothetical protein